MGFPQVGLESVLKDQAFNKAISGYIAGMDKISAKTHATAGGLGGVFAKIGTIAAGMLSAQVVGSVVNGAKKFFGEIISGAADAQTKEAQLDAVLKSTGEAAAKRADEYAAAAGKMVTSTAMSGDELGKLGGKLTTATARLHDMERAYAKSKNPTESATLALQKQRETVAGLTSQIEKGGVKSTTTLAQAMGLLPPVAQMTKQGLLDVASSLSKITPVEDDAIVAAEAMLMTFTNIGKDVFPQTTETLLDMATAMNSGAAPSAEQLKAQAIQLGKAMNDPIKGITALTRVGVTFTAAQKAQIAAMVEAGDIAGAQKIILAELAVEFGGSAKAAGQTFAGAMTILNNQMGNVKETIGMAILPYLTKLAVVALPKVTAAVDWLTARLPKLSATFNGVIDKVKTAIDRFKFGQEFLGSTTGGAVNFLAALGVPADVTGEIYKRLLPIETAIRTAYSKIRSAIGYFQGGLLQGSATKGIGWILTQVLGLSPETAAKITSAIQPIETAIRNVWGELGATIRDVMAGGIGVEDAAWYLLTLIGVPKDIAEAATDWIGPIEIAIRGAVKKLGDVVGKVKLGGQKGGIAGALGALFGELPDLGKAFNGIRKAVLDAAGKALGKIWETFAKAHPEIANPLEQIFGGATAKGGPDWTLMLGGMETLGTTLSEKLTPILKTAWDTAWATISQVEIPFTGGVTIGTAFDTLKTKIDEAKVKFDEIAGKVDEFVNGTLVPILAGVGTVAMGAFVAAVWLSVPALVAQAVAVWAVMAPLLPLIGILAAVSLAVGLLVAAWQNDWGGIRTFMTDLWENTLKPAFSALVTWFEVTIPAAITAVTGFWTGTLLPAIQGVWSWIQTNLIPLFDSVANVLSAVVGVALTAAAGLWQNVLLPALQAVGTFFTGTIIPAITAVSDAITTALGVAVQWLSDLWTNTLLPAITAVGDWFNKTISPALQKAGDTISTALGPAVEWVTGLFGKASGGLEGLGSTIKKVTDWFNGLAQKIRDFKLPAVLTPGSPTPFEQGLIGIGDALMLVTDKFFAFASNVSPEKAKAMQNVGSALKDMAKAIGEVAGNMIALNKLSGAGGGALDVGKMFDEYLERFLVLAEMAMVKIDAVVEAFGYNRIKKLRQSATRLADIINAVMVDLSGITERELPDMAVWFEQLHDIFNRSAGFVASIRAKYSDKMLADMAAAAASIAALYVVVDTDLDKIKPRTDPGWREAFALLIEQLTALGGMIVAWLGTFEQSVRNMIGDAAEVAVDVAALWQVLGPDLAKLVPVEDAALFKNNAQRYIGQLILVGGLIVAWLGKLSAEAVTMVKTAAEVAKPVAELFAVLGVDLAKLVPAPPNFGALFAGFLSALGAAAAMLIPALRQIRAVYGGEVLTEAAETAGLLRTIMDVLGLGQAFADLAKPENAIGNNVGALVTKVLDALTKATAVLVPGLTAIQTMWGGALEKVKQIAETMKAVFGGMAEAYKSAVEFATGDALNLGAFAARIAALNAAAGLAIAAAMPTAPTATPGAAGGGDSTSMATVLTTAMRAGFEAGALMLTERIVGAVKESFEGTMIEVTFTGGGARGDTASRIVIGNASAVNLAMAGV